MKKKIGCILCLCTVLMGGCSKEKSYQNLLNERIADALAVPLTSTDPCIKYYYSYQLPRSVGRLQADDLSVLFDYEGTRFSMSLDTSGILQDLYYQQDTKSDDDPLASLTPVLKDDGVCANATSGEYSYAIRIYQVDSRYLTRVSVGHMVFTSISSLPAAINVSNAMLRIGRSVSVSESHVIDDFANRSDTVYQKSRTALFENLAPVNGTVADLLKKGGQTNADAQASVAPAE
ncbi:MAG: hypothetical protein SOI44_02620 [Lactimicrobium sp.]|jgi:hypothetical protein|uniref:hypothetical protein n=1 Tax=Lactimicrobium sp. TaxID=2563780 RepID=UPI002F3531AF